MKLLRNISHLPSFLFPFSQHSYFLLSLLTLPPLYYSLSAHLHWAEPFMPRPHIHMETCFPVKELDTSYRIDMQSPPSFPSPLEILLKPRRALLESGKPRKSQGVPSERRLLTPLQEYYYPGIITDTTLVNIRTGVGPDVVSLGQIPRGKSHWSSGHHMLGCLRISPAVSLSLSDVSRLWPPHSRSLCAVADICGYRLGVFSQTRLSPKSLAGIA